MKKYSLLLAFLGLANVVIFGQHIPDSNFAAAIRSNCPSCIDSSDNLTANATTCAYLNVTGQNVSDLTGLSGFPALETLVLNNNAITSIPSLPNTLEYLHCKQNLLTSLPASLPASLIHIDCAANVITALPTLPPILRTLTCDSNQITALPVLPNTLEAIFCSHNLLTALPTLPDSLENLACNYNQITHLPALPSKTQIILSVSNQLTSLPALPASLGLLICDSNQITSLPVLPANMLHLACSANALHSLPTLPNGLEFLSCGSNNISGLPTLPSALLRLHVQNSPNLACLPVLPASLNFLNVENTGITCLPNLPTGVTVTTTLPLCIANNSNACPVYGQLSGVTFIDYDNDCLMDSLSDVILPNMLVSARNIMTNTIFTTYSNQEAKFALLLPFDSIYLIEFTPQPAELFQRCPSVVIMPTNLDPHSIHNLGAAPTVMLPLLEVDIETPFLRRCFESNYFVKYSNVGTMGATNTYIDIEFDSYLAYVSNSANFTATDLGNNTYRFNIGDIAQSTTNNFNITVDVSCDAVLGQVHCTNAHIYPDLTASLANWSGPIIELMDSCMTDSVLFQLTNIGNAMSTTQTYQIIEDNLMYRPATPFLLAAGQSLDIVVPTQEGKIYRIEATQAAGFPAILGDNPAWAVVQNCNGISSTSANFVQQFYTNYGNLSQDNDCEANRGAYDPNDKNAQILGYGAQNCIAANTNLDYKIRFQNTGTDTAFRVFILDTLNANVLDINTIRMGASSHNYTWELLDNNVLRFIFDNIGLVDSFTNEPLSNGFISFSIDQKADLPVGSRIENSAAIYFDFNAPVITNTAMHTICADFVLLSNTEFLQENVNISAAPNPFDNQTIIQISATQNTPLSLQLYDATGRIVQQLDSQNNQFELKRNDLPSGVYFYQIFSAQQPVGRGKLMAR